MTFTSVSSIILMFFADLTILKTLMILKPRRIVVALEMFRLLFIKFMKSPISVPITIAKSNLLHESEKYRFPSPIILKMHSKLKIMEKM